MELSELKKFILEKRKEGKVVVMGIEGPMSMPLEKIIQQPADGLLYDLNRLEETTLTFIDDPKWVNDFAVALVIRKLMSSLAEAREEIESEVRVSRELAGYIVAHKRGSELLTKDYAIKRLREENVLSEYAIELCVASQDES